MTVKKLGRPTRAGQRRQEILQAMATVVARDGLADTTMSKVAQEAGLQRTLVLHYFGDRNAMVQAFIAETVAAYGDQMLLGGRVDRLFAPGAYRREQDLVVWTELVALAARDAEVRSQLQRLWLDVWLPKVEQQLADAHPTAARTQISATAYALACLVEAHWAFHLQGVATPKRRKQAQAAARLLLATLDE